MGFGGKGGGGGGASDAAVAAIRENTAFQKQVGNRALALAAPFNEVGYNSLGDLASIYGVDGPTLRPNYEGDLDSERFVPIEAGTVEDRLQALGPAPASTLADGSGPGGMPSFRGYHPTYGISTGVYRENGRQGGEGDRGLVNFNHLISDEQRAGRGGGAGGYSPNPAYEEWKNKRDFIVAQGDLDGPLSTEERRNKVLNNFYDSPIYQLTFQNALDEGTKAISRSAAARGRLNSAPTFNAIGENAGNLANRTFGQFEGGLSKLAGFGTTGLAASTNALNNTGAQVGAGLNNLAGLEQSAANQANANSSGFGGIGSLIGLGASFL